MVTTALTTYPRFFSQPELDALLDVGGLTAAVFTVMVGYTHEYGEAPSPEWLQDYFEFGSVDRVWKHLRHLERAGLLKRDKTVAGRWRFPLYREAEFPSP